MKKSEKRGKRVLKKKFQRFAPEKVLDDKEFRENNIHYPVQSVLSPTGDFADKDNEHHEMQDPLDLERFADYFHDLSPESAIFIARKGIKSS